MFLGPFGERQVRHHVRPQNRRQNLRSSRRHCRTQAQNGHDRFRLPHGPRLHASNARILRRIMDIALQASPPFSISSLFYLSNKVLTIYQILLDLVEKKVLGLVGVVIDKGSSRGTKQSELC